MKKINIKLENELNRLSNLLNEEQKKVQALNDKLLSLKNNTENKNLNELNLYKEMYLKDKKIEELKEKISRYPCELNDGEKMISIIFTSLDESIIGSIICKNTDNFSLIEKQIYKIYPEYKNNIIFKFNEIKINRDDSLEENKLNNNSIINLIIGNS